MPGFGFNTIRNWQKPNQQPESERNQQHFVINFFHGFEIKTGLIVVNKALKTSLYLTNNSIGIVLCSIWNISFVAIH